MFSKYFKQLKFSIKKRALVLINLMTCPCRMYKVRPEEPEALCYVCADRGGWPRCKRSKELKGRKRPGGNMD